MWAISEIIQSFEWEYTNIKHTHTHLLKQIILI